MTRSSRYFVYIYFLIIITCLSCVSNISLICFFVLFNISLRALVWYWLSWLNWHHVIFNIETVVRRCSVKKVFLKTQSLVFTKIVGLWHRCFPVKFTKFLRTPFVMEHLRWLLLSILLMIYGNFYSLFAKKSIIVSLGFN